MSVHFNKGICMTHSHPLWSWLCIPVAAFHPHLFGHYRTHCNTTRTVAVILSVPCTPPPNGNEFQLLWDPTHEETRSHCVLWLLTTFPLGLPSLDCIHEEMRPDWTTQGLLAIIQQRILSSSLRTTNIKFKIYRTAILPVVLHGQEIQVWSFSLRENIGWGCLKKTGC